MNSVGYFEIQSSNPAREIAFYSSVFDWSFTREDNLPIEYYSIKTGNINGGLLLRTTQTPPAEFGTNAFTCSIEVGNFDEVAESILDHGGRIALPKFTIPKKCYQGYFLDQDNNVFGIFEVNENA
jgi:predicted enzyme related to lactoylglutathione lyase